nr:hypothetical protein [Pandoravirus massiliensis]
MGGLTSVTSAVAALHARGNWEGGCGGCGSGGAAACATVSILAAGDGGGGAVSKGGGCVCRTGGDGANCSDDWQLLSVGDVGAGSDGGRCCSLHARLADGQPTRRANKADLRFIDMVDVGDMHTHTRYWARLSGGVLCGFLAFSLSL